MSNNIKEYNNILIIRNHLAKIPTSQLLEMYRDYDYYLAFLNVVSLLEENDSAFLLLDDSFSEKILSIILIHRFDSKDKDVGEYVNGIIEFINTQKSYSENMKNVLKNNYLAYQEEKRKATFHSNKGLIDSMAYDAIVFSALQNDTMDQIMYDDHYILSLNFIMDTCPELFEDKNVTERAIKRLEQATANLKLLDPRKKFIKQTRRNLENMKKEEE